MPKRIFDTSALIRQWNDRGGHSPEGKTAADAERWARELIDAHDTDAIVTPVYIEFVAGVTNRNELELTHAFLAQFKIVDGERITMEDWRDTRRRAQRVPRSGKRRQLGDCLIAAIADRLHYGVISFDEGFPR